jgi:hypothetical protein
MIIILPSEIAEKVMALNEVIYFTGNSPFREREIQEIQRD